jgi:magnesium transporter
MLTASAMQHFEVELAHAVVLTLFIPLIMSSGGNSGSQATSLIIRALALGQIRLRDWWRVALRELPTASRSVRSWAASVSHGSRCGRCSVFYDYGAHWPLIALTVGLGLIGIVTFGSLSGSMLPFLRQRLNSIRQARRPRSSRRWST